MGKSGKRYRVYRGGRKRGSRGLTAGPAGQSWPGERAPPLPAEERVAVEEPGRRADALATEPSPGETVAAPEDPRPVVDAIPYPDETFLPPAPDEGDEEYAGDPGYQLPPPPPPRAPRRRRIRVARIRPWRFIRPLLVLTLIAALLVVGWGVAGYFGLRSVVSEANERLDDAARQALSPQNGSLLSNPTTILFLGIDTGGDRTDIGRSDAIVLMRTDPGEHRISLLSVPRDLRVEVPGSGLHKINAAYANGGAALAIRTVEQLTGTRVNHVAIVDFNGFAKVIDELGGVTVDVPRRIVSNRFDCPYASSAACSRWDGWKFSRGRHTMDGERALIYARTRENRLDTGETDITRGGRQQQVLQAIVDKLVSLNTFVRLPFLGGDVTGPLATDLSTQELFELAWVKFRASDEKLVRCRLGGKPGDIDGVSYLIGAEGNSSAVNGFLGRSAPRAPAALDGPFAPGCTDGAVNDS